ncbi:MAG: lycopene cyclase family protein [Bacteroidetes bacterium]|nr:lycopene cyclase family protein [Bacteroidota bacterium]MDA1269305.1 lycopene cyclase family protein [Bacteroidota bacterium]
MKKYDYILAGGGCAGLSLVYHLLESSLKDSQILIIDPSQGEIPNKTWCYWSKESLPIHPKAARFSWNSFYLKDAKQQLTQPLNELSYHHLNSHDFYAHVLEKIGQFPNVHFLKEEVLELIPTGTKIQVATKAATFSASFVFDSRIKLSETNESILNQVFIGIRIKVSEPIFDPKKWGLMDFETRPSKGFDFIYTLPFSTDEALIEYTTYTKEERSEGELLEELQQFLLQKYGSIAYDIKFQESGKIPMSTRQFSTSVSPRHIPIGTAAGWTKPSTGYTFAPIQENCSALVDCLERGILNGLNFPRKKRFIFYDNILLSIAHHWPKRLPDVFINLFSTSPPDLVFRFLAEKTSFWEELKLLSRLKFGIFLKGLSRYGTY